MSSRARSFDPDWRPARNLPPPAGRSFVIALAVLQAAVVIGCQPGSDSGVEIQNVILISIDTLRADHLESYGHPFVATPVASAHWRTRSCISSSMCSRRVRMLTGLMRNHQRSLSTVVEIRL